MKNTKQITLPTYIDDRGKLTVLEDQLPFKIERIFWIHGRDGEIRGGHRHIKTRQVLVALNGEIEVYLKNKNKEETYNLNQSSKCLLIEPEQWHTMKFRENGILLVLASHKYDKNDYIQIAL